MIYRRAKKVCVLELFRLRGAFNLLIFSKSVIDYIVFAYAVIEICFFFFNRIFLYLLIATRRTQAVLCSDNSDLLSQSPSVHTYTRL